MAAAGGRSPSTILAAGPETSRTRWAFRSGRTVWIFSVPGCTSRIAAWRRDAFDGARASASRKGPTSTGAASTAAARAYLVVSALRRTLPQEGAEVCGLAVPRRDAAIDDFERLPKLPIQASHRSRREEAA